MIMKANDTAGIAEALEKIQNSPSTVANQFGIDRGVNSGPCRNGFVSAQIISVNGRSQTISVVLRQLLSTRRVGK